MSEYDLPGAPEDYIAEIERRGPTDKSYLTAHFNRFVGTFRQFVTNWTGAANAHVLDIGAHWLHQSVLYARAGFRVTAADFGITLEQAGVRDLAAHYAIDLLIYDEIASGKALDPIPENSVDVVLFSEILEHITFNPVAFWKSVYNKLAPGGRIIVTTPNYYAAGGRAWQWKRFIKGFGAGISSPEILHTHTYGHHWKEFSRKEVCHYFCSLSSDFQINRAIEVDSAFNEPSSRSSRMLRFRLPQLYAEIDLVEKQRGITVKPAW